MKFIWTKRKGIDLITWGLEQPVSHFAVLFFDRIIFHSTFSGVDLLDKNDFFINRDLVYEIKIKMDLDNEIRIVKHLCRNYIDHKYDWKFLWSLIKAGLKLKIFRKKLENQKYKGSKSGIICQEVASLIDDVRVQAWKLHNVNTPYDLYKTLKGMQLDA